MLHKLKTLMGSGSVLGYFLQALPIACLVGIGFTVIRLIVLKKRHRRPEWPTELLRLLFVCYLTGLVSLVVLPANFWLYVYDGIFFGWWDEMGQILRIGEINLIPTLIKWLNGELTIGSWVKTMLIGNIAMLIPFGFLLPLVMTGKSRRKILLISGITPLCLESLQLFFGRSFDVDDLICNALGIALGLAVAFAVRRLQTLRAAAECGES